MSATEDYEEARIAYENYFIKNEEQSRQELGATFDLLLRLTKDAYIADDKGGLADVSPAVVRVFTDNSVFEKSEIARAAYKLANSARRIVQPHEWDP